MHRPPRKVGIWVLFITALVAMVALFMVAPIPQPLAYHNYADSRTLLGVPNFWNVISNILFFLAGVWGFLAVYSADLNSRAERIIWNLFFLGIFLLTFTSSYYHYNPDNETLVGDRLTIAWSAMLLFSAVICERVSVKAGAGWATPLVALGLISVIYWHYTETIHAGDLRPYAWIQFYPVIGIPIAIVLFPPTYTGVAWLWGAIGWYVVGKVFELTDATIYNWTGEIISGHTIKHLTIFLSALFLIFYLKYRRPLCRSSGPNSLEPSS